MIPEKYTTKPLVPVAMAARPHPPLPPIKKAVCPKACCGDVEFFVFQKGMIILIMHDNGITLNCPTMAAYCMKG